MCASKHMLPFVLWLIFFFQITPSAIAQHKSNFNFVAGYGFYQGYHVGGEYFFNSKQHVAGFTIGGERIIKRNQQSIAFALNYKFPVLRNKKNELGNFKWNITNNAVFWQLNDDYYLWKVLSVIPSVNRTFVLHRCLKFTIGIGSAFNIVLFNKRKTYKEVGWPYHVMPDFKISIII